MKKILLATSALALTASVATAADITLGGDGYYGIIYAEDAFINNSDGDEQSYAFAYDLDFDITASGTSDSGLVFGASMDIDEMDTSQGPRGWDSTIFVSGAFGTLAMGDTDGAAEAVVGDLDSITLTGLGDFNENFFLLGAGDPACEAVTAEDGTVSVEGACGQGPLALYTYEVAGFTGAIGLNDDEGWSVGAGYDGGIWNVGLAYETVVAGTEITLFDFDNIANADDFTVRSGSRTEHYIGAVGLDIAGVALKGTYGRAMTDDGAKDIDLDQYGLSATYTFDAISVGAFVRRVESSDLASDPTFTAYGIGAGYDLGGGLSVVAGLVYDDEEATIDGVKQSDDVTTADFGFKFSF